MLSNIIPEDPGSQSRASQAITNVCESFHRMEFNASLKATLINSSPSPFVIDGNTLIDMATIHEALVKGIRGAVEQWSKNESIRNILSVHPRIEKVLLMAEGYKYRIGTLRPDLLFQEDGPIQVCEINARFPLNGFLLSALPNKALHKESMRSDSIYAELGVSAISAGLRFVSELKTRLLRFGTCETIWLLQDKEPEHDTSMLASVLDVTVRRCTPRELACDGDPSNGLYFREEDQTLTEIQSCVLELHQEEFLSLDDDTLEALARLSFEGKTLNDFRTVFLAHDKRILYLLQSGEVKLDIETQETLKRYIVPTFPATLSRHEFDSLGFSSYVFKPSLLGKGEGILMEKNMSSDEFFQKVKKLGSTGCHIVQAYVVQRQYNILNYKSELEKMNVVGTLASMDGKYYGPALFRSNTCDLVSLTKQGVASYPSCQLKMCPAYTRFFARKLAETDLSAIRRSIINEGIALVGVESPLGCKHELRSFLIDGLGAKARKHSDIEGDVWDVRPVANWTVKDARSHTSLAFEVHTDASFEQNPPRFVAMSVVHADRLGGGRLSVVRINDIVKSLDTNTVHSLKTIRPRWIVPDEFKKSGVGDVVEPVLMSNSRGRFRRDKLCTKHLSHDDSAKFWNAFEIFFTALHEQCARNEMVVPEQSVIILDNQRFAHARTPVFDSNRHLHRVRFDLVGFE